MTFVKFMNGEVSYYEETNPERIRDLISSEMNLDRRTVGLIENEEKDEDNKVDFFVFIGEKDIYILNMTQGNFFVYEKKNPFDNEGYVSILKSLFEKDRSGFSHWSKEDKIIFVPDHLKAYAYKEYGRLIIFI